MQKYKMIAEAHGQGAQEFVGLRIKVRKELGISSRGNPQSAKIQKAISPDGIPFSSGCAVASIAAITMTAKKPYRRW